ncbi:hypothetical protein CcaCcLH18_00594 [Colletotrichum camelliae]|nr:hypothetical protein CcaCcLH18_00594 [Colletotrichum camelliae]
MRLLLCLFAAAAVALATSPGSPTEPQRHLRDPVPDTTRDNGGSPRPGQSRQSKYNVCCRFNAEKTKCVCIARDKFVSAIFDETWRIGIKCFAGLREGNLLDVRLELDTGTGRRSLIKQTHGDNNTQMNREVGIETESIGTEPDSWQGETYSDFSVALSMLDAFGGYYNSEVREAYINFIVDYCNH